jgi:hypothetical protein
LQSAPSSFVRKLWPKRFHKIDPRSSSKATFDVISLLATHTNDRPYVDEHGVIYPCSPNVVNYDNPDDVIWIRDRFYKTPFRSKKSLNFS